MADEIKQPKKVNKPKTSNVNQPVPVVVQQPSDQDFKNWLESIYNVDDIKDEDIFSIYDLLKYKGFDRKLILKQLAAKIPDKKLALEAIMVCSLQGPVRASKTKLSNGSTLSGMGVPASGAQGTEAISCQRISAATADIAAWMMKKVGVPKRLNHDCPAWLQFPAAGAILLPDNLRKLHMDFSQKFSPMIGGVFNEQIYMTMIANAYLEPKLHLLD